MPGSPSGYGAGLEYLEKAGGLYARVGSNPTPGENFVYRSSLIIKEHEKIFE
jgi:hypothetical protein